MNFELARCEQLAGESILYARKGQYGTEEGVNGHE